MLIEGPFKLGIVEKEDSTDRELHLDFTEPFRQFDVPGREAALRDYIASLSHAAAQLAEDSADRRGMLTMMEIAEQLLPHICADEIPLSETIVMEMETQSTLAQLVQDNAFH